MLPPQKKGQNPRKRTEVSCLLDKEFKLIITKMLRKLCRQVDTFIENFHNNIKIIKRTYQN